MALLPSLFAEMAEEDLGEVAGQVSKVWEPVLEQTKGEADEGRAQVMQGLMIVGVIYLTCGVTLVLADLLYRGVIFRDLDDLLEAGMIVLFWGPLVAGLLYHEVRNWWRGGR